MAHLQQFKGSGYRVLNFLAFWKGHRAGPGAALNPRGVNLEGNISQVNYELGFIGPVCNPS